MSDGAPPTTDTASDTIESIRVQYDWASTRPSIAVIETIAKARDEKPTDLPSLPSSIDLDALDVLCKHQPAGPGDPDIQLSFSFGAHEVTVGSDGTVIVETRGAAR